MSGDPNAIASMLNGPLDDSFHVQLAGDLRQPFVGLLVSHDRSPGNYPDGANMREFGDERVGHSVREVILGRITGEILKRQHGQRSDDRRVKP